ncbi:probable receptor-like protein kinase At3g17420 [Cryptomeria japonica]|uniref:probable receptor-like protein kinase At3g17420 n=1 Tax=Cryptomeria japonica TaxID=3369 RepID=UPI0027D9DF8C|nr:probable receptor-like protein kinase At3g17420 [Cryptomeria japonica]
MYIDGCTLDDYLRGNCIGSTYSWKKSFRMIMGIAKGIEFLHLNKIIHVDIKPQNIMVDAKDDEAKLVDFGFSRHVDWEGTHQSTDKIIGTKGYWAPEYCWNNKLSYKHDVYSFGIVVLEIITSQKHVDQARSSSQFHIPGYVRHMIENNRFEETVDTKLKQDGWDIFVLGEAFTVANIALRCAHPDKAGRPDMNLVVTELNSMLLQPYLDGWLWRIYLIAARTHLLFRCVLAAYAEMRALEQGLDIQESVMEGN